MSETLYRWPEGGVAAILHNLNLFRLQAPITTRKVAGVKPQLKYFRIVQRGRQCQVARARVFYWRVLSTPPSSEGTVDYVYPTTL